MIVVQNSQTIPLLLGEKFTISKIKNDHAIVFLQAKKCSWHYEEHLVTGCSLYIKFKANDSSIIPVRCRKIIQFLFIIHVVQEWTYGRTNIKMQAFLTNVLTLV